ncbi:2-isopropylmalate synthase [Nitrococcus mobilis]|uniref:2-isopropylmalate synthase n=1 Tax=Nitrococcus mobilis Nb-231 TaxID=314278 RepID=A4BVJ0_9GAMM|nr:2-isopropylmalate synthase [Nitrococcus mobilis]EAR20255.1 2-isopropylmalate synthase [Nitrococcus mobilis Nb-231]
MLSDPSKKYRPYRPIRLTDRTWPDVEITRPPVWMSTDLRDGNQALFEPMSVATKLEMFDMLLAVGFKEIEVGFPSASQTDYTVVRRLIEEERIPEDVRIEVITQARDHLIEQTMASLRGAKRAIVHLYNATSPVFRKTVFRLDRAGVRAVAVHGAKLIKRLAAAQPQTEWTFQYSPETFSATELDFAKEVVDAVTAVWEATPEHPVIVNLPATVEMSTPNVFADQIEWMHRHLARRDGIVLSVHPHNDRGSAVAAAEFAVMAGAERVEGCLFGNGERTGNVDLVTLALNLYTQGVHPRLDFSRINDVARTVEQCTRLPIHPRHPYAGDLVFTAFSGSHQDAIKKGFTARNSDEPWAVPYLPIDPEDLGRSYESVIRVNSQSGKGGVAYLLEREYGLVMPRRMQVEFSRVVQQAADTSGKEIRADEMWAIFRREYLEPVEPIDYVGQSLFDADGRQGIRLRVRKQGHDKVLTGMGNGPIDALLAALAADVRVQHYKEHSIGRGSDAQAVCFVELACDGVAGDVFGVGIDGNIVSASVKAVISGINRIWARLPSIEQTALLQREQAGRYYA